MAIVTHFYIDDEFASAVNGDVCLSGIDWYTHNHLIYRVRNVSFDFGMLRKTVILTLENNERPAARPE